MRQGHKRIRTILMTSERKVKVKGKFVPLHVMHTRGTGGVTHFTRNIEIILR